MSQETTVRASAETTATTITADEAAELLGLHKVTLYESARRGEVPCRRAGRRYIFVRETLLEWLRTPTVVAATP